MPKRRPVRAALRWAATGAGLAAAAYLARAVATWRGYGHPVASTADEADALLDQFMPRYDVVERRRTRLAAPPDVAMEAASAMDIRRLALVRALFKGRSLLMRSHKEEEDPAAPRTLVAWMRSIGWTVLADDPGHELVMGTVTQPWNPTPTFQAMGPEQFVAFHEPGYVKIAWTLRAEPSGAATSTLYHETRAVATDVTARTLFRRYWTIFSPGIVLIRWTLLGPLGPIRRVARRRLRERAAQQPPSEELATRSRYARLSPVDNMQLRTENPSAPTHIGALCVVEAAPLLDANGELNLAMIARRLERRLARVPELRRIVVEPPPLGGAPIWVDDPHFSINRHIHTAAVAAPGNEASLLETTERLLRPLLDRSRPLWELWFLTGLEGGRVGLLFKLHHAIADGLAAIALLSSFFDLAPDTPDPPAVAWIPAPAPAAGALIADNLRRKVALAGATLLHPARATRHVATLVAYVAQSIPVWTAAPRTSLNTLIRAGRYQRVIHLDLEAARRVAHQHGAKVNDVILAIVTAGARALLIGRDEAVHDVELIVAIIASLRGQQAARELGNVVGALTVPLPVGETDALRRLERIAAATRAAKARQPLSQLNSQFALGLVGWLAARGFSFVSSQRMINFQVSNLIGPAEPLYVLGARIEDVIPLSGPFGNVTLAFGAMSYCGRLNVVIVADRTSCADVDILTGEMARAWEELARVPAPA